MKSKTYISLPRYSCINCKRQAYFGFKDELPKYCQFCKSKEHVYITINEINKLIFLNSTVDISNNCQQNNNTNNHGTPS